MIRIYYPAMKFKYMVLFDEKNRRTASYQIPNLPEIDCQDEGSELSRDGSRIIKGIINERKTGNAPLLRLKGQRRDISWQAWLLWRVISGEKINFYIFLTKNYILEIYGDNRCIILFS